MNYGLTAAAVLGVLALSAPIEPQHNLMKLPSFKGILEVRASIPGRMRLYVPSLAGGMEQAEQALNDKQEDGAILKEEVSQEEIAEVVSTWTGIPVSKMMQGELDKLKGLVPMFVPMVVSSLSRMETMSMALESRAFGNTKHPTEMTEIRVRPGDLALLAAGIILMIVAIVIRVRFGSLNWASQVDCWSRVLLPQL